MPIHNISMSDVCKAAIVSLPLCVLAGAPVRAQPAPPADPMKNMRPVTDEMLRKPDPATG